MAYNGTGAKLAEITRLAGERSKPQATKPATGDTV
jgi:hypothetical protein